MKFIFPKAQREREREWGGGGGGGQRESVCVHAEEID